MWQKISDGNFPPLDETSEYSLPVLVTDGETIFEAFYGFNEKAWYSPVELSSNNTLIPIFPTHWSAKLLADETKNHLIQILDDFSWIKVKQFREENFDTLEEKYINLSLHHQKETKFLIDKCKELANMILSQEKLNDSL